MGDGINKIWKKIFIIFFQKIENENIILRYAYKKKDNKTGEIFFRKNF